MSQVVYLNSRNNVLAGEGKSIIAEFIGENIGISFLIVISKDAYKLTWNVIVCNSGTNIKLDTAPKNTSESSKGIKLRNSKVVKSLT